MESAIQAAACALLASLAGYFTLLAAGLARSASAAARHAELERAYLQARIQQMMEQGRLQRAQHEAAWNGFRKFEIVRKVLEADHLSSFYLAPHDRKPLPPFLPGQYLTFQLAIPDAAPSAGAPRAGGSLRTVIRCYSLSDSPNHPDYYRVTIKRVGAPPDRSDLPPGLSSSFFHDHLKEGDIVDVKAPAGHFYLDLGQDSPVVLIAGGIGITPLLSMLNASAEAKSTREIWFFYGVRNRTEHIMKDHLERTAREHPNVRLKLCYSNPRAEDVEGRDYHHGERVSVNLLKRLLPSKPYLFYLCGPPPMMNQIIQDLQAWGVPKERIMLEAFGATTVKRVAPPPATEALTVTFAKSGKTCPWDAQATSLLEFAEKSGVAIDFGCRAGNCGTCITAVKSGDVQFLVEQGAKPETGSCLMCISVPKTHLVLDA